ncbi:MAG: hypothetical protein LBG99_04920 [Propionibacteriaceae bacterium]|jgi:putative peptidoglycan lipid II flippase|nr:hypothetical protein [Propionibacteriaceae bacterium]
MSDRVNKSGDDAVMNKPKLFSSTMLMASGTLVSRTLGMVRVLLVGYLFTSTSIQADIFNISSSIPSQMYLLLAGGILNAILVPQLMRSMKEDADGGQAYSDRIVTLFGLMVLGITALLVLLNPFVVRLITRPTWRVDELASQYDSLIMLTALVMPQVFFFGMFFLGGQILNSRGSFGPLMWAPALNNVIQVAMLGIYALIWGFHNDTTQAFTTSQILLLGLGSVFGVAIQMAILIPFLKKVGFRYRPRFDFLHTGLGSTAHLAKWALGLVVVDQLNFFIITRLTGSATLSGSGAGSFVFTTAMLVSLLPHALLTVSLATALLPSLSKLAVEQNWEHFTGQFISSIRTIYVVVMPLSLIMASISIPGMIMAYGIPNGGVQIGWTLIVLSAGLIPFTLRFLVMKGFNSMQNTRTPFFVEILFVAVTSGVSLLLVLLFKVPPAWVAPSVAFGYVMGYITSAFLAWILFRNTVPGLETKKIAGHTLVLFLISVPASALAWGVMWLQNWLIPGRPQILIGLVIAGTLGFGVYWGLAKLVKIPEVEDLSSIIRSRLRKEPRVDTHKPGSGD